MTNTLRALLPCSVSWDFPFHQHHKAAAALGRQSVDGLGMQRAVTPGDPLEQDSESWLKGDVNRKTSIPKEAGKSYSFTWEVTRKISLVCRSGGSEAEFAEMPVAGGGSLGQAVLLLCSSGLEDLCFASCVGQLWVIVWE